VLEVTRADRDIEEMRTAYETFLAQTPVPESVVVRAVNAGGVSSLALEPAESRETGVLYLHGGGYAVGSAYGYRPLAGALVAAAGVGALVADYRLAPEHPFPAALEDAISAYRWLVEQRGADQIVLAGDSVGGGLVCSLLLALRGQNLPQPAGAVLLCPAIDLSGEMMVDADPQHAETMRRTIAAYLNGHPIADPIVSPLLGDLSGLPPLLVQAATGDLVLPESRRLVELATEHGVDARLELYPVDTHVFHVFWSFLPEAADALQSADAFIRERLASRPATAASRR